jgi:hypothetical protein
MGLKGEKTIYTLFDSGAGFSCITPENADEIGFVERMRIPLEAGKASRGHFVRIDHMLRSDFYFGNLRMSDEFMVVPDLSEEAIIDVNRVQKWRIKLDFENDSIIVDPKVVKLILKELQLLSS